MSGLSRALENRDIMGDDGPLKLLRTENAPYTLGLLAEHLGGAERTRTAAELYDLLDADLEELRLHDVDLPRTAQQYCASWVKDGFLYRRAAQAERTEEFSLTEHAHAALRILDQLHTPRDSVTRSRLALLTDRLRALAQETDPDTGQRIADRAFHSDVIAVNYDVLDALDAEEDAIVARVVATFS